MKNIFTTILTFIALALVTGCSTINFNERYENANWNKVIIAPFEGKNAVIAEDEFEHALHPWIVFMIMPLFAFANAGVPLEGLSFEILMQPLTLAIILGLFIGKQVGVFGSVWLAIKFGFAEAPQKGSMAQLYGVSLLAGIGFTMSLFIGALAFSDQDHQTLVRIGVIFGSLLSGITGAVVLTFANKRNVGAPLTSNAI